jgi:large subunit ribosomal protein L21
MEAIVKISGKQYRVAEGQRVTVDRLSNPVGEEVTFDQVLLLAHGDRTDIGTPVVSGAAVTAKVVAATRGPKIVVFKYKAKKRYRRTRGARADQSLLQVVSVSGPPRKKAARDAAKPAAAAAVKEA